MEIKETLRKGMESTGYHELRKMQKDVFDAFQTGKDLYIQSETGSGKTAAYLLPILNDTLPLEGKTIAVILTPTRELALQVHQLLLSLASYMRIRTVCLTGGKDSREQISLLNQNPSVIVGTAGRFLDLLRQGHIKTGHFKYIILDEADQLLVTGQTEQLTEILQLLPKLQTAMFSATMNPLLLSYLDKNCTILEYQNVGVSSSVKQFYLVSENKEQTLLEILQSLTVESAIVFFQYRSECEKAAQFLQENNILTGYLTGKLEQRKRTAIIRKFRNGEIRVLCASDVASRGLDVHGVTNIIHFGLPYDDISYIHRAGRSMHEGGKGNSILLLSKEEMEQENAHPLLIGASPLILQKEHNNDLSTPITKKTAGTIGNMWYIRCGKKDKIRTKDIVGALCEIVPFDEIGAVTIYPDHTTVNLFSDSQLPLTVKIKGIKRRIERLRNETL